MYEARNRFPPRMEHHRTRDEQILSRLLLVDRALSVRDSAKNTVTRAHHFRPVERKRMLARVIDSLSFYFPFEIHLPVFLFHFHGFGHADSSRVSLFAPFAIEIYLRPCDFQRFTELGLCILYRHSFEFVKITEIPLVPQGDP